MSIKKIDKVSVSELFEAFCIDCEYAFEYTPENYLANKTELEERFKKLDLVEDEFDELKNLAQMTVNYLRRAFVSRDDPNV